MAAAACCDTWPDASTNVLDVGCAAMLQGSSRLQRGLLFAQHLRSLFPQPPAAGPAWPRVGLFPGAHDKAALYASALFRAWATDPAS